ncbi:general substrate transporter [Penicillium waksmanii]|uniref:general substrate transporter n=1 Tax=Penicillium waksmanii TaxID=69791 RepID=UPI002547C0EE|nr:general substrate transporter [Penicillium waksmanii]KAJ5980011.1 general substrate transporter [Penicillium waksmanii]
MTLSVPARGWWSTPCLIRLNLCLISLTFLSSANGYDSSLLNGLQSLPIYLDFMGGPEGTWLGFINTLYWIGAAVTATAAAWVSNQYGRKKTIWLGYVCLLTGTVLQTAAPSRAVFMAGRALAGASMGWMNNAGPALIAEVAYPTHQGIATALFMTCYYLGSIVAAWVTYGTRTLGSSWAWRIPSLFQLLMPLLSLPGFWFVAESPRWMVGANKIEEARQTLIRIHAGGDSTIEWVEDELQSIQRSIHAEIEAEQSSGYAEMVRTPGNRHRFFISVTLGFFDQWVGNGLLSYYLAIVLKSVGVKKKGDQLLISACLQIWNLMFALLGALSVDRMGRRTLFLFSGAIMLISYILMTGLYGSFAETGNHATGIAFVPFVFVYFAGYDIALTPLLTSYPCEIWPFRLRSRGLMITWMSCIIAVIFNIFVNPIALEAIGWKYYIVYVVILVVYCLIVFFAYPETRGRSLEQMSLIFDKEDTIDAHSITSAIKVSQEKKNIE